MPDKLYSVFAKMTGYQQPIRVTPDAVWRDQKAAYGRMCFEVTRVCNFEMMSGTSEIALSYNHVKHEIDISRGFIVDHYYLDEVTPF